MFSIDTEPEFAFLEDAWGVSSNAKNRHSMVPSSKHVVGQNHTDSPLHKVYQERNPPVNETPSKPHDSSPSPVTSSPAQNVSPNTTVIQLQNPILYDFFHVYKDEYRDEIIENILLHHVHSLRNQQTNRGQKTTTLESLREKMKTILSQTSSGGDAQDHEFLLLFTWFAIALLLFLLLVKGGR